MPDGGKLTLETRNVVLDENYASMNPEVTAGNYVMLPFEPYQLLSAAHAEESLVQGIVYVVVPDQHPPGPAGHTFTDNTQPPIDVVSTWLAEQHL